MTRKQARARGDAGHVEGPSVHGGEGNPRILLIRAEDLSPTAAR